MKEVSASKFVSECGKLLDDLDEEGILITRDGKPVAKLSAVGKATGHADLIGALRGRVLVDPDDPLLSTGAWTSKEWGDANAGRRHDERSVDRA